MSTEIRFDWFYVPPDKPGRKWNLYNVFCDGELLVERTHDPEFNACREYLKRHPEAESAIAAFYHEGKKSLTVRIGRGAELRTKESDRDGTRIIKYESCQNFQLERDGTD
jgi:hypothetical protein